MKRLTPGEKFSLQYHSIFNYPLTEEQLVKWVSSASVAHSKASVVNKGSLYTVKGREAGFLARKRNEKVSIKKKVIAKNASALLSNIPTVKVVAISGALAMDNASPESDIDLLIVTSTNALWLTRPLAYLILTLNGFKIRSPKDPDEKDKLCLNLWMDETDLKITEQNVYTAHEIAQLVPLANKKNTYEKLIWENKWIKEYWPNAVSSKYYVARSKLKTPMENNRLFSTLNSLAYYLQRTYMKGKVTRETVTLTRAFFHPKDWGKEIETKLKVE